MTSRILCQGPRSQPVRAAAATSTKAPPALNRNFFHETHNRPSSSSSSSSSSPTVDLSFDLYTPARPKVPGPSHNPIIFLHGLFGSRRNNRSISKILAQDTGRYVYALDLRNHGSSPHAPRHDYIAMADDVSAFMSRWGISPSSPSSSSSSSSSSPPSRSGGATLIGHSMGAKTAMTLALKDPDLVSDIVAVDNAPVDTLLASDFSKYILAMKRIEQFGVASQKEADRILGDYEKSLPIRQFLLTNLHRPEPSPSSPNTEGASLASSTPSLPRYKFRIPLEILARALANLGDFPFKDPSIIQFRKPALFVRGTRSTYVPDDVIPLIGQFFPFFKMVDVECGHWVTAEKPEEFRKAVLEFFDREE